MRLATDGLTASGFDVREPSQAAPGAGAAGAWKESSMTGPVPPTVDRGTHMARQWPLRDFLELGALPGAVPSARLHARQIIWEWALTPLTEAVEQVVSELVTNSVAAARAMPQVSPVRLWLLSDTRKVLVLVWDADPRPPALTETGEYAESGRGLFLVQAFSERWGSYATPRMGGKIVWTLCGLNLAEPAGPP